MTRAEKLKKANTENIQKEFPHLSDEEAYKLFVQRRYHKPEKAEERSSIASKAGKASQASINARRTFEDRSKASESGYKSWENRRKKINE